MPDVLRRSLLLLCIVALTGCARRPGLDAPPVPMDVELAPVSATSMGFHPSLSDSLDAIMEAAVADSAAPGMSLAVGRYGRLVHFRGYGRTDWAEDAPDVTVRTLYDLASLTKVVATTTAAMMLEEEGRLDLHAPVCEYLRGFDAPDKAFITPYMLLAHISGMTTRMLYREARGRDEYLKAINEYPLQSSPGREMSYSDWNMIVMQLVIEQITGTTLDAFLRERVWEPLTMRDTDFRPNPALLERIAPTEIQEWRGGKVHGIVHDENAWGLGGVAGHAGLFSSARDLAVFAQMLMNGGSYGDVQILQPETVARWTSRQAPGSSRALGWDTPSGRSSAGDYFSAWSFGHTGFTGTSLWMDPRQNLFVVLLSNHVNPRRGSSKIFSVRRQVADAVQRAVLPPAYGK